MSRKHTSGFEVGLAEYDNVINPSSFLSISTTTKRSGARSLKVAPTTSVRHAVFKELNATAALSTFFLSFYLNIAVTPNATTDIAAFTTTSGAGGGPCFLRLTSAAKLQLANGIGTQIGSDSAALSTGTWYLVELKMDQAPASGSRVFEARLNGSSFASTTTSTDATTVLGYALGSGLLSAAGLTGMEIYIDDVRVNDAGNSPAVGDNSYPPAGYKLVAARPAATGDVGLNPFVIGVGAGANWTNIEEIPPDDLTTYIQSDNVAGTGTRNDYWKIDDPVSTLGMGAQDTVRLVSMSVRGGANANTASTIRNLYYGLRSASGGTLYQTPTPPATAWLFNQNINTTGFVNDSITSPHGPLLLSYSLDATTKVPRNDTGAGTIPWPVQGTNSLTNAQFGVQRESTAGGGTNWVAVTAAWLYIEYIKGPELVTSADETDTALGLTTVFQYAVGVATETDEARPVSNVASEIVDRADETDTARGVVVAQFVGTATETDTALGVALLRPITTVTETDEALGLATVYQLVTECYDLPDLGPTQVMVYVRVKSAKMNPTDVGEMRINLLGDGGVLESSTWFALTDTPTNYFLFPVNGQLSGLDISACVEYRRVVGDFLTPQTFEIEEFFTDAQIASAATETDIAFGVSPSTKIYHLDTVTETDHALPVIIPGPPIAVPHAGFRMYDLARTMLECVCEFLGSVCPTRRCVVPGAEVSFEDCCSGDRGGQLTINLVNTYLSRSFPSQDTTATEPCSIPFQVYTYRITLIRCAPVGRGTHPPTCVELDAAAHRAMDDQELVLDGLLCCLRNRAGLEQLLGAGYRTMVQSAVPVGPEGGCVGFTQDFLVGLPTCWTDDCTPVTA